MIVYGDKILIILTDVTAIKCIEPCALLSLAFEHLIYINQYFLCLSFKNVYILLKLAI